ncbi:MAG TPA: hypothetical protein VGR93_05135 [Candidatus Acidoferrales bacterium]|nr:hypothetical protein [Candidatus Acidoferrales bacterium]
MENFIAAQPGVKYIALLSFLPLKSFVMIPKFMWLTLQTQRQLSRSPGLIGYSLLAEPFHRRFWTLSAWQDSESLMDFVNQIPHSKIMQSLAPRMGKTRFVQWPVIAADIPLDWKAALSRM